MSDIKDFITGPSSNSATSIIYIMLMANVLGLAVYMGNKRDAIFSSDTIVEKAEENKKTIDNDTIGEEKVEIEKTTKGEESQITTAAVESSNTEDEMDANLEREMDNKVIDFSEIVLLKKTEKKQPLKPLIWRFPK